MVKIPLEEIILNLKGGALKGSREDVRAFFMRQYKLSFATQGRAQAERWVGYDREPRYEAFKRAVTGDLTLLRWKGSDRLYRALTRRGAAHQTFELSAGRVVFGTDLPYADDLLRGGVNPFDERFPARNYLALSSKTQKLLAKLIAKTATGQKPNAAAWRQRA